MKIRFFTRAMEYARSVRQQLRERFCGQLPKPLEKDVFTAQATAGAEQAVTSATQHSAPPITSNIASLTKVAATAPATVEATITQYISDITTALAKAGITVKSRVVHFADASRKNVVLEFSRDGVPLGSAIRQIGEGELTLSTIGLNGGTGVLRPLYGAESQFARSAGLTVSSRLTSIKTRMKFEEFYPGFTTKKGGRTLVWQPPTTTTQAS
jgi:hypothetical protein